MGNLGIDVERDVAELGIYGPMTTGPDRLVAYAALRADCAGDPAALLEALRSAHGSPLASAGPVQRLAPNHAVARTSGGTELHLRSVRVQWSSRPTGDRARKAATHVLFLHGRALAGDDSLAPGFSDPMAGLSALDELEGLVPSVRRLAMGGWFQLPFGQRARLALGTGAAVPGDLLAVEDDESIHLVIRMSPGLGGGLASAWRTYRSARDGAVRMFRSMGPLANMALGLAPGVDVARAAGEMLDAAVEIERRGAEIEVSLRTSNLSAAELGSLSRLFQGGPTWPQPTTRTVPLFPLTPRDDGAPRPI